MEWTTLISIIGSVVIPSFTGLTGWLHMRLNKIQEKLDKTYTKRETKEIVGLITDPIKDTTERLIESLDKHVDAMHKLEVRLAASND